MFSLLLTDNNDVSHLTYIQDMYFSTVGNWITVHVACLGIRIVQDNTSSYKATSDSSV